MADRDTAALRNQSVGKAAALLRASSDFPSGTTVASLARAAALPRATAVRMIDALIAEGLLARVGDEVFEAPHHPCTEALLSAVPSTDPGHARIKLSGDIPSAAEPPSGSVFQTRCPRKLGAICEDVVPPLADVGGGRLMACHIPLQELRRIQQTPPGTAS